MNYRGRIVVAMSGGVDSSATAALLKDEGWEVVGATLRLGDGDAPAAHARSCCTGRDIRDARRVADALGIPHYVIDAEAAFRRDVVEPFAESYLRGETPVPCVACNRTVKFRDLLAMARDLGAVALANGHYVRRVDTEQGPALLRAADARRDQSYFLFATTREQLSFLRFPLGGFADKEATRALAARFALPVAAKPDSQDICFVPDGDYASVVARLRPEAERPGAIVDVAGRELGRHPGIAHFTVGQRRGLGVGGGAALYVVRLEPETGRVVVGPRAALGRREISLTDLNWLGGEESGAVRVLARVRSTRPPVPATLWRDDQGGARVVFDEPEQGVAPGQACVLYDGERLLGGGWIRSDAVPAGG